jgi:hypothetical protein
MRRQEAPSRLRRLGGGRPRRLGEEQEAEAIDNWRQYLVALVHARRRSRGPVEGQ